MKPFQIQRWLAGILAIILICATGCTKGARANRHLQKANKYFAANQYDRAEIEYLNVMRYQPTNTVALRNLAEIYYANESYQRAGAFLSAVKQRDPSDTESRGKLARLMLSSGAIKDARAEVDGILQLSPTNENALLVLAELSSKPEEIKTNQQRIASLQQKSGDRAIFHVARGLIARKQKDVKGAESEFKSAVALEPKSPLPNLFLGGYYAEFGSNTLAEPYLKAAAELSPIRSQNRLRYANFKAQTAGINTAKPVVAEVTSKAPDYVPGWLFSARMAISETNYTEALANIKRALDRDAFNFEALLMRSDLEIAQGKPEEAVKTLEKLTEINPKNTIARYQLALAYLRTKDQTRASLALNQAVTLDPLFAPAVLLLAETNIRKGDTTPAIDSLTRLIKARPQVEKAHVLLGAAYVAAGRFNDALTTYNDVLKKFPNNIETPYLIGLTLKQQGRVDEAKKVFEKILANKPDDRTATMELISLDIQAKNPAAAESRLKAWMEKAPQNPDPVFELAKLRYQNRDAKGAEALCEKVLAMNKDAVGAYILLGRIYLDSNQLDPALEKTKAALAKNPKDTGALLLSGIIYENKKDYTAARDAYENTLALDPRSIIALNNLATIYAERLNDVEKAYPLARKAQELSPNYPPTADTFGWILSLRGEYEPALVLLKEAVRNAPTEAEIQGHLGITQYLMGDEAGARASLESALKTSSAFGRRDEVEKSLAILNINPAAADQNSVASLEKRLTERPADPVALARLSAVYEKTGKIPQAISIYEKALTANPKLAIAAARLAELNDRNQNSTKALELARNARKLDSADPRIAHIAGRIASRSADFKDQQWGLSLLQESSQKKANDPAVTYDLAWAYYTQGRVADAETSMKAALASGANLPFAADAKRVLDFLPLSDPARAAQQQAQIDQALQADANYLPAMAARAGAQQKSDAAAALKTYDQILTRYPGFTPAIRNYVILSATQPGDSAKALALATRARESFRDDIEFTRAVGILQYQKADYQTAARTLAEVGRKRPNDETVQYYLGMSHYQLKQPKETKVALKKAIDLQPKAPFASEVQRILNELK